MNIKIIFAVLLTITFYSCKDCMDCQVTTDINLSVEYYSLDSISSIDTTTYFMSLDSITNFTYNVQGYIKDSLPIYVDASTDMTPYISPINIKESCGAELKEIKNSTLSYETVLGDSTSGLHKYNWSETWDCK